MRRGNIPICALVLTALLWCAAGLAQDFRKLTPSEDSRAIGPQESALIVFYSHPESLTSLKVEDAAGATVDTVYGGALRMHRYILKPGIYALYLPGAQNPVKWHAAAGMAEVLSIGGPVSEAEFEAVKKLGAPRYKTMQISPAGDALRFHYEKGGGTNDPGPSRMR